MKIAPFLCFSALLLFAFVSRYGMSFQEETQRETKAPVPNLITANSVSFEANHLVSIMMDVPLKTTIDGSFQGVVFTGDTALMKYIRIFSRENSTINNYLNLMLNLPANDATGNTDQISTDSVKALLNAGLSVRIGVGDGMATIRRRLFSFRNLPEITLLGGIHANQLSLNFHQVARVNIKDIQISDLEISGGFYNKTSTVEIQQKITVAGSAERLFINKLNNSEINTEQLAAEQVYISDITNSQLFIYANELFNSNIEHSSSVAISGNPKYIRKRTY